MYLPVTVPIERVGDALRDMLDLVHDPDTISHVTIDFQRDVLTVTERRSDDEIVTATTEIAIER